MEVMRFSPPPTSSTLETMVASLRRIDGDLLSPLVDVEEELPAGVVGSNPAHGFVVDIGQYRVEHLAGEDGPELTTLAAGWIAQQGVTQNQRRGTSLQVLTVEQLLPELSHLLRVRLVSEDQRTAHSRDPRHVPLAGLGPKLFRRPLHPISERPLP